MGKYQRFDEIPVWQEAAHLYQRVLDIVEQSNVPLSPTFRSQLERACLCVSSHVAESFERMSTADLIGLLVAARSAAAEVQSMVAVVSDRPKVAPIREVLQQIRTSAESCGRQLGAWKYAIENPGQKRAQGDGNATERPGAGPSPGYGGSRAQSGSHTIP
jgi:four helix bundle protein